MSSSERRVGRHLVRWGPPDLALFTLVGEVGEEDARALLAELREGSKGIPRSIALVVDVSRMSRVLPEARAAMVTKDQKTMTRILAIVGAAFHQRVMVTLIAKAFSLVRKESMIPLASFDSEAEARAWIEQQRRPR